VLFYHWQNKGKAPACLALRFASTLPPVTLETVRAFVKACAVPGVTSFSQAARLVDGQGASSRRTFSALPDSACRIIRETFAARRQAEIAARKLVSQFSVQTHALLAADGTRSRRLVKLLEGLA
jgi:hypothetical protein